MKKSGAIERSAALRSEKSTILYEKAVANGVTVRAVRDADGRIYKQIVRDGKATAAPQLRTAHYAAPSGAAFFEDFEGWDEVTLDWIPEGWSEINTPENTPNQNMLKRNINNTWYGTFTGDGYWTGKTPDGEKECFIHFTYTGSYTDDEGNKQEFSAAKQDEWLITPEITVGNQHKLFFEMQFDEGSVYDFDWDTSAYDRTKVVCDFEILMTEDDSANWESIWKVSTDLASAKSDSELYDLMAVLKYNSQSVDIPEKFYGKKVKIAFRYFNIGDGYSGNSMGIDAVTVGATMPQARYYMPDGSLMAGLSRDLYAFSAPFGLFPAYADVTWQSSSNSYTESNEWQVYNPETGAMDTEAGETVVTNYPYSEGEAYPFPKLTARNSFGSDVYDFGVIIDGDGQQATGGAVYGGNFTNNGREYGVGVYDYARGSLYPAYFTQGNYCFGTSEEGTWGNGIVQESSANMYDAPAAPFAIDEIHVLLGALDADPDAEFKLRILGYDSNGYLNEDSPLIEATAKASDAVTESGLYSLPFKFYTEDEAGNNVQTYFVYDQPIVVDVYGYSNNPKVRSFGICTQYANNESGKNYTAMRLTLANGTTSWYTGDNALQDFYNALYFTFFGSYNFLMPEEAEITLNSGSDNGNVNVTAANSPENWWIEYNGNKFPLVSGAELDGWLTVSGMSLNGEHSLRFNATPTESERSVNFTLCTKGASTQLTVKQHVSVGVDEISVAEGEAQYYNMQGVRVANPENGMFIRVQNGKAHKVVLK